MSPKQVAGYVRVSRVGGREGSSFISVDVQKETIRRIVAANGWELDGIEEDPDVSGAKKVVQRKLGQLVERVEAGELAGIVVWRVSRFSRDLLDAVTQAGRVRDAGGFLIGEDLDTRAPMGRAMLGFLAGWAEEEREHRTAGFREAQARSVARGVHFSPIPPTGYLPREQVPDPKSPGQKRFDPDQPLRVDPVSRDALATAFRMRAEGRSMSVICRYLESEGVCTSGSSEPRWSATTLANVFKNPAYMGRAHHGDLVLDKAHEAIVSPAVWAAVQDRRALTPPQSQVSQGVLTGILRCAVCRKSMQHASKARVYRCRPAAHVSISAAKAEAWLEERLWEVLGDVEAESAGDDSATAAAAEALAAAHAELSWYASIVAEVAGRDAFLAGLQSRQAAVEDAERAYQRVSSVARLPDFASLREAWPDLSREERREVYAEAFPVVWVRHGKQATPIGDRVLPVLAGEALPELPVRGRRAGGDTTPLEFTPITW